MNGATIAIGTSSLMRAMARQRYLYFAARALRRAGITRAGWRAPPFTHGAGKLPEARRSEAGFAVPRPAPFRLEFAPREAFPPGGCKPLPPPPPRSGEGELCPGSPSHRQVDAT